MKLYQKFYALSVVKKIVIFVAVVMAVVGSYIGIWGYSNFLAHNTNFEEEQKTIYIPTDSEYKDVLTIMIPILKDVVSFDIAAEYKEYPKKVKGGKYIIQKEMNNKQIINTLITNNQPVNLTFRSIENAQELASVAQKYIEADSISLVNAITDKDFYTQQGFNDYNFLAMYIPNTYEFFWNSSAIDFRSRLLKEYKKFWNKERMQKIKETGLASPQEVITLASIVQRETYKVDEQPTIAGAYINRLRKGIKLQADPTVTYGMKHKKNDYSIVIRRMRYKHLKFDSPYNTYLYKGLPPGPIVTPNYKTIDAVLNYKKHDYIFFVANPKKYGYHLFAKTYAQHNVNKRIYVKWLRENNIR